MRFDCLELCPEVLLGALNTVRAVVREGKIELLEPVDLPEGTTVLARCAFFALSGVTVQSCMTMMEDGLAAKKSAMQDKDVAESMGLAA